MGKAMDTIILIILFWPFVFTFLTLVALSIMVGETHDVESALNDLRETNPVTYISHDMDT